MSSSAARLYAEDFVRWTEEQSAALREAAGQGINLPLDWENLAEEVESLGRCQRHAVRSRIAVILEHLLKLEHSPATDPQPDWMETIDRERDNIELLLRDSPSLRGEVAPVIAEETRRAIRRATRSTLRHGEEIPAKLGAASYNEEQVLGDWFPAGAPHPNPPSESEEREGPALREGEGSKSVQRLPLTRDAS